jgi:hypothetical protein
VDPELGTASVSAESPEQSDAYSLIHMNRKCSLSEMCRKQSITLDFSTDDIYKIAVTASRRQVSL